MKEVNEELEGHSPRWDGERWIEPDEVLENPETVADNATNETREAKTARAIEMEQQRETARSINRQAQDLLDTSRIERARTNG